MQKRHSASQKIPRLLWNPNVHYHVRKSPRPVPVLSQMNVIQTLQPYVPKVNFNIIFLQQISFLVVSTLPAFQRSSHLTHVCCMPRPSLPPRFDHTEIWRRVQIMELLISLLK
jgi:hypothetical protein